MQLKKAQLTSTPSMRRSKLDAYFLLEQRWWWFCLVPAKRPEREHIQEFEGSRRTVHPDYYVVLNGVATSQDELRAVRVRFREGFGPSFRTHAKKWTPCDVWISRHALLTEWIQCSAFWISKRILWPILWIVLFKQRCAVFLFFVFTGPAAIMIATSLPSPASVKISARALFISFWIPSNWAKIWQPNNLRFD